MSTGVDAYAFTATRNVTCASKVEMPVLNAQLARAIQLVLEDPDDERQQTVMRMRLLAATSAPTIVECPFEGAIDVDFDRPGHGFFVCNWCGSLVEYED